MPEDSKKNQQKGKHEAKEQRKPRQQRQHAAEKSEKKTEKKVHEPKVTAPPKPTYEEPGQDFYNSLKRETDEILKITEEANAKYKKKEIQSNWTKYEMPIETYEEMEEQEYLGADYEKLIQAPVSAGGHFQFKHEKSWDINTGPSLYDKYFEINMDNLATAILTVPFYKRNSIDQSVFSQNDILTMDNRATKYKRKYCNDKSYTTPELESLDAILNSCKEGVKNTDDNSEEREEKRTSISESADIVLETSNKSNDTQLVNKTKELNLETKNIDETSASLEPTPIKSNKNVTTKENETSKDTLNTGKLTEPVRTDQIDEIILESSEIDVNNVKKDILTINDKPAAQHSANNSEVSDNISKETKKTVIESPEDLEKWLDNFLDG